MDSSLSLGAAFLIGLAGSVHCVAMCGGIVGALSFSIPRQRAALPYMVSYHAGRLLSYSLAGALTGGLGAMFSHRVEQGIVWLNLLSGLFLLLLALYIGNWWRGLAWLEKLGAIVWKPLVPVSKHLLPFRHPLAALPYGIIWGWLPCGLVYSTLSWSLAAGSWHQGAGIMLLFGLGTLPALLSLGSFSHQLQSLLRHPATKRWIALLLAITGLVILGNALLRVT
ncbi:sulfite exporter TauE/SafE family protein [Bowmanella dokdonensis]|uniref:Sulfite exporter TauE/SafE family protein n=1 Tax=Bowmanella dokdonensis TaxID=751969 RepID=A0A939IMX3_9ALTE|nr:sulfite exporter TauE/SafE family protein [Bowmanella dokdonensis]MBN7824250.1 sulfite exporter TauE/SafE family protein [Bowmanella dokdonensis]